MSTARGSSSDGLTPEELRERSALAEEQLRIALERLEWTVRSQVDLGRLVSDHAEVVLGGAFALGLLFGLRRRP